jgi:hypothetical protein
MSSEASNKFAWVEAACRKSTGSGIRRVEEGKRPMSRSVHLIQLFTDSMLRSARNLKKSTEC